MLTMHQKPFGGRAQTGPAGELKRSPGTLAAKWGLRLRVGGREGRERREGKGVEEGRGKEREKGEAPTRLSGYATVCAVLLCVVTQAASRV